MFSFHSTRLAHHNSRQVAMTTLFRRFSQCFLSCKKAGCTAYCSTQAQVRHNHLAMTGDTLPYTFFIQSCAYFTARNLNSKTIGFNTTHKQWMSFCHLNLSLPFSQLCKHTLHEVVCPLTFASPTQHPQNACCLVPKP